MIFLLFFEGTNGNFLKKNSVSAPGIPTLTAAGPHGLAGLDTGGPWKLQLRRSSDPWTREIRKKKKVGYATVFKWT